MAFSSSGLRVVPENLEKISSYLRKYPATQTEVKFHFDRLPESRKQSYVNALGYASRNPLDIPTARRATPNEISAAVDRISNHLGGATQGSYGYVEGNLTGTSQTVDDQILRSGAATVNEPQVFTPVPAQGANGNTWLRNTDAEYKALNKLAHSLGGRQVGDRFPGIGGSIKIVSENPYCPSCIGVIHQFSDMFPGINLILVDGTR